VPAPIDPVPPSSPATQPEFDLKPCPWCGGPADIEEIGGKDGAGASFSVGCHDGDGEAVCFGFQSLTSFSRKSDAVKAWNTRAKAEALNASKNVAKASEILAAYDAGKPLPVSGDGWLVRMCASVVAKQSPVIEILRDIREWLRDQEDAEYDLSSPQPTPNQAMKFAMEIDAILAEQSN
jgi:hypothetical protein